MANPEHLEILKEGRHIWNSWREKNSIETPELGGARLFKIDLQWINLSGANLTGANLGFVDLNRADISKACFQQAQFVNVNFERADLSKTNMTSSKHLDTNFYRAYLDGANFREAKIDLTNFSAAHLYDADFNNSSVAWATFGDNDLSTVKGFDTVHHESPSTIGIDTIYRSTGKIPESFLRGCGVPENFITYMHSLTVKALEFYKCFISFTEADDAFSERLYNDLQMKGVRCWRWKEDAKWGKTLMHSIDEAVRLYDKLIIICSEQSLNSPAVIREIERALQKEDEIARQGKDEEVLFPIRLDDYIFTRWTHHRKADVIAKNIGDFRKWNESEQYKKAFERLLRDLKAEEKR